MMYNGLKRVMGTWNDFYRACLEAHQMQQEKQYQLKISEVNYSNKSHEVLFTIQIVKTGFYPTYSATELVKYPDVLSLFDPEDKERILRAASGESNEAELQKIVLEISATFRDRQENITYFKVTSSENGNTHTRNISAEALSVSQLLSKLNPIDAFKAGFAAGQDELQNDIDQIRMLRADS